MSFTGGKYAAEVAKGRVQILSTPPAGVTIPISTSSAPTFGVWNSSSSFYAMPLWFSAGYTSGTIALGELGFANQFVGNAIGTALSAITGATSATLKNALLGGGQQPVLQYTPSSMTLGAGGTQALWLGSSIESASAGTGIFNVKIDFDGLILIPPGQVFFPCASVAQTANFTMSLAIAEIPAAEVPIFLS